MADERVEDKLADESRRGGEAKRVLEEPILIETLEGMDAALVQAFRTCPVGDDKALKEIRLQMHALEKFRQNLFYVVQTGRLADMEISDLRQKDEARQ